MKGLMTSLICFVSVIAVINGETSFDTERNYTDQSDTISVNSDGSAGPELNWSGTIISNETTNILLVIEEMLLDQNDSVTITNENKTAKIGFYQGIQDPFSLIIKSNLVVINLKTSASKIRRMFKAYYIMKDCEYVISKDSGIISIPLIYNISTINCSFILSPSVTSYSKRSITFINPLYNQSVEISGSGSQDKMYTGSGQLAEIIGKNENTNLTMNFKLKPQKERVNFTYENVLDASEYVKLGADQTFENFNFNSTVTTSYQPQIPSCHWIIESESKTLSLKFSNLSLSDGSHIVVSDGNSRLSKPIKQISSLDTNILGTYILSKGNSLRISLVLSNGKIDAKAQVRSHKQGGYFKDKGEVSVSKSDEDSIYLLEVKPEENVVLSNSVGKLLANASLYIYDDFSENSKLLLVVKGSLPNYPIVSDTSRMMIIAKNFTDDSTYKASFQGYPEGCYRMTTESSYDYIVNNECQKECKWIVTPDATYDTISLHLHLLHFETKDVVTISLLDKSQTKVFDITSKENIPEMYLPAKSGFVMITKSVECNATKALLHVNYEKLNGCNGIQQLSPGKKLQITSPNYPNSYPILAQCWSNITSNNTGKNLFHVAFDRLALSPTHCLNFWQNFMQNNATAKTFGGNYVQLPDDMLFQPNLAVEFVSKPCNTTKITLESAPGFSLNVTSADCGKTITAEKGNFSTPNYPNAISATYCFWLLEVPASKDVHHPNIINFTITIEKKDQLKIYDGGSVRDDVIQNVSKEMLSRTNKLLFVYERNAAQPSTGVLVEYHSQSCTMTCQNGLCLHPDWVCNGVNDCKDNTDELNCTGKPAPGPPPCPKPEPSHGISSVALWLGLPIAFIFGILAALFVPPLYRRFRSSQYHQFRDISAEA